MIEGEIRPDRENNIAGRREHWTVAAKRFAYQPFDPVAANRVSHFPGDTDAQPVFLAIVGKHNETEPVPPDSPAMLINPLEFPGLFNFS